VIQDIFGVAVFLDVQKSDRLFGQWLSTKISVRAGKEAIPSTAVEVFLAAFLFCVMGLRAVLSNSPPCLFACGNHAASCGAVFVHVSYYGKSLF